MSYIDRFIATDNLINHLQPFISAIGDTSILSSYAGFLSVSAVTVYELAIKDIFNEFAAKKNKVFGNFTQKYFSKVYGKIFIRDLNGKHLEFFGDKYKKKFNSLLDKNENIELANSMNSIKNCYSNLIQCRHEFVHKGNLTLTANEVINSYEYGKKVIHCLNDAMKR